MKKLVWAFCSLFMLLACGGNKTQDIEEVEEIVQDTVALDTLNVAEAEEALPARADELFDDFLFEYAADSMVQRLRTYFPLPYTIDGERCDVQKKNWRYDPLFSHHDFYTVIYNEEQELQLEKDTSLVQVRVEMLNLESKRAKRYQFKRYKGVGVWVLSGVTEEPMTQEKDPADFLEFYRHFATDSLFQRERVSRPLKFITIDPEDDFCVLETTLDVDQWFAFRPQLPTREMTNFYYGQQYQQNPHHKLICFRGKGNGFNNILTFSKQDGRWMLTCFEDTSE